MSSPLPEWFIWYQIVGVMAFLVAVLFYVYHTRVRLCYKAYFYRKTGLGLGVATQYEKIGEKEFKKDQTEVRYKKKTFFVNLERIAMRDRNKTICCFDYENGDRMVFGGIFLGGDEDLNDMLLESGALQRIIRGFTGLDRYTQIIILALVACCGLCFALGLFASPVLMPQVSPVVPPVNGTVPSVPVV